MPSGIYIKLVQRGGNAVKCPLEDVGVDHDGFDIFMPEEFLNGADALDA